MGQNAAHKKVDLLRTWQALKNDRKLIAIFTCVITLFTVIYCIFATPIFTAKLTINPPKLTDAGVGMSQPFLGLNSAFSGGGGGLLGQKTDSDINMALLDTNSVKDMVIRKFNLMKYYKKDDIELTRKALAGRVQLVPKLKSGFIEIDVDDENPKLAAEIANYYGVALGQLISNISYNKSQQRAKFFNDQIKIAKTNLNNAESNLKAFVQAHGIIVSAQSNVIVGMAAELQAQLVAAQTQLQSMAYYASENNSEYKALQARIESYKRQLSQLNNQESQSVDSDISIPVGLAPELTQQYAHLTREFQINVEIYKILVKQYEANKLDVLSEIIPTAIQIVDPAQVPLHKSKPKRLFIIAGGILLSILLSSSYIIFKNRKQIFTED